MRLLQLLLLLMMMLLFVSWCRQATGDVFFPPVLSPVVLKSRIWSSVRRPHWELARAANDTPNWDHQPTRGRYGAMCPQ